MGEEGKTSPGGQDGGSGDQTITIGDKKYTSTDVENLVKEVSTSAGKAQEVQKIKDACEKYNMEPEEFLENAMGSFSVLNNLITEGVLDTEGNLVKGGTEGDPPPKKKIGSSEGTEGSQKKTKAADDIANEAIASVDGKVDKLIKSLEKLEDVQTKMVHSQFREKITAKHSELSDQDADDVLARAMNEGKKSVWEYAKDAVVAKGAARETIEKAYAKEHGLDFDTLKKTADENKLKEKGPEGGSAPVFEGKKLSFRGKPGDKDVVTPLEASEAYLDSLEE